MKKFLLLLSLIMSSEGFGGVKINRGAASVAYEGDFVRVKGVDGGIVKIDLAKGALEGKKAAFDLSPWPAKTLEGVMFAGKEIEPKPTAEFYGEGDASGVKVTLSDAAAAAIGAGGDLMFVDAYR